MCRRRSFLRPGLLLLLLLPALVLADPDGGPLFVRDHGPLRLAPDFVLSVPWMIMRPDTAQPLDVGRLRMDVNYFQANVFAKSRDVERFLKDRDSRQAVTLADLQQIDPGTNQFFIDTELARATLALDYQFTPRWQGGIELNMLDFGGGVLDTSIENFHDAFGLGQAGRLGAFKDQSTVYVRAKGQEFFKSGGSSSHISDIILTSKYSRPIVSRIDNWLMGMRVSAKIPLESRDLIGTGEADFGFQLLMEKRFVRSTWHVDGSVSWLGENSTLGIGSQATWSATTAWLYEVSMRSTMILQATLAKSPLKSLNVTELEDLGIQAIMGWRYQLLPKVSVNAALIENVTNLDNTPDIAFNVGVTSFF